MITQNPDHGITAAAAAEAAGITYRQLDHWDRQGWVTPSVDPGTGRASRRLYAPEDVVRLDLLRHLAMSKVNPSVAGPEVRSFDVPAGEAVVLWGPVPDKDAGLVRVAAAKLHDHLTKGGGWVVYDPAPLRRRLAGLAGDPSAAAPAPARRSTAPARTRGVA